MDTPLKLTETQVRAWTGTGSFGRGYDYYTSKRVINLILVGTTLSGQCAGSAPAPYHVEVALADDGIASASCTCPVGTGGRCKHVAALLLTWLHGAEPVRKGISLERSLNERSKEDLIQLILKLVQRDPDLAPLLEMPLPGRGQDRPALDAALIRRQVRQIIDRMPQEWGASYAAAGEVGRVVSEGDAYARAGDWGNAAVVYATVAQEILDDYESIYEEEGEFLSEVGRCAQGLAACLDHIGDGESRRAIVRSLFAMVRWDITSGGLGLSDDAEITLIDQTTAEERAEMAAWVRGLLPESPQAQGSFANDWRQQALGGFLLRLEQDTLDDEAYLALCRQTGRLRDAVGRLLQLGRVEEAVEEARQASDYELLTLSRDIWNAGQPDVAEEAAWRAPLSNQRHSRHRATPELGARTQRCGAGSGPGDATVPNAQANGYLPTLTSCGACCRSLAADRGPNPWPIECRETVRAAHPDSSR